ncbi:MAG: alpha/beta fold hydrolase [Candidatus Rokuibacteriota bacterium]
MPKVRVGDIGLHYIEHGRGDPLLLVMGFGGDHLAWGFQVPAFAARHRVIAFDNRGVGQTDAPDAPYSTRVMADDAVGLLDALGIERAHVLGVSMGGMIAQELALNHPGRVRTLQLHCTYARPDGYILALVDAWCRVRTTFDQEHALRTIALWLFAPATYNERPELVETLLQTALANPHPQSVTGFLRQGDAVRAHDTLDRLEKLRCPTLVSVAEDDILVPPRFTRELAARIPGAELRTIPGAGHVYFWERPEVFNEICLDFIARHAKA